MPNYYFVDTNIILSYCNPYDKFHQVSLAFFSDKLSSNTYLLFSVHEEYFRKLQDTINDFFIFLKRELKLKLKSLQILINKIEKDSNLRNNPFFHYIIDLFNLKNIREISFRDASSILFDFNYNMRQSFEQLVHTWIKKPHKTNFSTVLNTKIYQTYFKKVSRYMHPHDTVHLALASYEVRERNKRYSQHEYYFYTNDNAWIQNNLESKIGIRNFHIKKIPYQEDYRLKFDPKTNSFSIKIVDKRIYLSDGL